MGFQMNYDCDLDVVKTSFSAQSSSRLFTDIAKEAAAIWQDDDVFYAVNDALIESDEKNDFILGEEGLLICASTAKNIERPVHMFYKLSEPLKYKTAQDSRNVDLVFVLISPKEDGPFHLRRLSRASRLVQDSSFLQRLKDMDDKDAIRSQFMYPDRNIKAA